MESFAFALFNGVLYGMLLFLLASGLTLIFSMMGVLNFAHASFFMLGAYFAYQISVGLSFWAALLFAPHSRRRRRRRGRTLGLRPVHRYGHVAELPVHLRNRLRHRGDRADGVGAGARAL